jgi:hypothetical protein
MPCAAGVDVYLASLWPRSRDEAAKCLTFYRKLEICSLCTGIPAGNDDCRVRTGQLVDLAQDEGMFNAKQLCEGAAISGDLQE